MKVFLGLIFAVLLGCNNFLLAQSNQNLHFDGQNDYRRSYDIYQLRYIIYLQLSCHIS